MFPRSAEGRGGKKEQQNVKNLGSFIYLKYFPFSLPVIVRIWNTIDEKNNRIYLSTYGFDQADFYIRTVLKSNM